MTLHPDAAAKKIGRPSSRPGVVVIGSGDVGSAVAVVLQRAGFAVVICDTVDAPWSRRGMAFTDAWYVGNAELDGAAAVFCSSVKSIPTVLDHKALIAATTWSWPGAVLALQPVAVVDARMRKRRDGGNLKAQAPEGPLTMGIGPGFVAGGNVDAAIESSWGERMGALVTLGPTLPFAGEPHLIGNAGRERFVYAPKADRFATGKRIGDRVVAGEVVGALGSTVVMAPLDGVLRGLAANGARVPEQFKIVEVDPRGEPALCFGLGERPLAIAHGVLRALTERGVADQRPLCTVDAS